MQLFQNSGLYRAYLPRLARLTKNSPTFAESRDAFIADRFGASHVLLPVLTGDRSAFFTNGDDEELQLKWAREHGIRGRPSLENILLAQIENHRAEVFYNVDPLRYGSDFVRKLPGCVKRSVAWRAAPSPGGDFSAYGFVVCNFPSILESYRRMGWKSAWFAPAHDPVMDAFASNRERPIDVLFVGSYSRHHLRRAGLLEDVALLHGKHNVAMHLELSRLTRLVELTPSWFAPVKDLRRPNAIRAVSRPPVFGLELYRTLSMAKIVFNCAIDMAGNDRGNMRCFESMGCGCTLLSDAGNYPSGMDADVTMSCYSSQNEAMAKIGTLLGDPRARSEIAAAGYRMISRRYSKQRQWERFVELVQ